MTTNFSGQPYYDDFSEDKHFHKILFNPGNAVQARELTQVQSILQDQIGKFGKFVLSDGSRVTSAKVSTDTNVRSLSIVQSTYATDNIDFFNGLYIVGVTSKVVGQIIDVDIINYVLTVKMLSQKDDANFSSSESLKLFVDRDLVFLASHESSIPGDYLITLKADTTKTISCTADKDSNTIAVNTATLQIGDELSHSTLKNKYSITRIVDGSTCEVNRKLESTISLLSMTVKQSASRVVFMLSIEEGVFFTNGHFVKNDAQFIIPDTKTAYPTCVVGFEVRETIIDFIDDSSLLDPALGSSNYSAPGADRYKIELILVSKPYNNNVIEDLTSSKFIEIAKIRQGKIDKLNSGYQLGELEKILAKRMYDHAGDFIIKPFTLSFSENKLKDSSNTFAFQVSPGHAYVNGYEVINPTFSVDANKARSIESRTASVLSTPIGNYIKIKDITGLADFSTGAQIEIHKVTSGQSFSSKIGTAYVRNQTYSGTANTYNLFLFDIQIKDKSDNVKSVLITTSANNYSSFNFKANTITTGASIIYDNTYKSNIFPLSEKNISGVTSIDYDASKVASVTFTANVATTISESSQIYSGSGILSTALKDAYFYVVASTTNGSFSANQVITSDKLIINLTNGGLTCDISTAPGYSYTGTAKVVYTIRKNNAAPKIKTLNTIAVSVNADTVGVAASLGYADVRSYNGIYKIASSGTLSGNWSAGTYSANNYVVVNDRDLYRSKVNSNSDNPVGSTKWEKQTQQTTGWTFNNGQRTTYYDHASLTPTLTTATGKYVAILNYYSHSSGSGYCAVNSYPKITDVIEYPNITSEIKANIKDSIDFRPRRTDLSSTLTFPASSEFLSPVEAIVSSAANVNDISYGVYQSRMDRFIVNSNKEFKLLEGVPAYEDIAPPKVPLDAMGIATIKYNAYGYNKNDIVIKYDDHRRYTMNDIGVLDKRIDRVEYYTSLSLAESNAMSKINNDALLAARLSSGILADSFEDTSSLSSTLSKCSIDLLDENCLRPAVTTLNDERKFPGIKSLKQHDIPSTSFAINQNLLHFTYTVDSTNKFVSNKLATSVMSLNPFNRQSTIGSLHIAPSACTFFSIQEIHNTILDDGIREFDAIKTNPELAYNSWNIYNTINNTRITDQVTSIVKQGQYEYDISSSYQTSTSRNEQYLRNIKGICDPIDIRLHATGLAPYTKVYVFINGVMVNAWVTGNFNPLGEIQGAKIHAGGTGYYASNTTIAIIGANTTPAAATLTITGNTISDVEFTNYGLGYYGNTSITITSPTGSGAIIYPIKIPKEGNHLYTNAYGDFSGVLRIPSCSELHFPTGELHIEIADDPIHSKKGSCYAEALFYATRDKKIITEDITSIRRPVIKRKEITAAAATDDYPAYQITFSSNPNNNSIINVGTTPSTKEFTGNTVQVTNETTEYVIVSPKGTEYNDEYVAGYPKVEWDGTTHYDYFVHSSGEFADHPYCTNFTADNLGIDDSNKIFTWNTNIAVYGPPGGGSGYCNIYFKVTFPLGYILDINRWTASPRSFGLPFRDSWQDTFLLPGSDGYDGNGRYYVWAASYMFEWYPLLYSWDMSRISGENHAGLTIPLRFPFTYGNKNLLVNFNKYRQVANTLTGTVTTTEIPLTSNNTPELNALRDQCVAYYYDNQGSRPETLTTYHSDGGVIYNIAKTDEDYDLTYAQWTAKVAELNVRYNDNAELLVNHVIAYTTSTSVRDHANTFITELRTYKEGNDVQRLDCITLFVNAINNDSNFTLSEKYNCLPYISTAVDIDRRLFLLSTIENKFSNTAVTILK